MKADRDAGEEERETRGLAPREKAPRSGTSGLGEATGEVSAEPSFELVMDDLRSSEPSAWPLMALLAVTLLPEPNCIMC